MRSSIGGGAVRLSKRKLSDESKPINNSNNTTEVEFETFDEVFKSPMKREKRRITITGSATRLKPPSSIMPTRESTEISNSIEYPLLSRQSASISRKSDSPNTRRSSIRISTSTSVSTSSKTPLSVTSDVDHACQSVDIDEETAKNRLWTVDDFVLGKYVVIVFFQYVIYDIIHTTTISLCTSTITYFD